MPQSNDKEAFDDVETISFSKQTIHKTTKKHANKYSITCNIAFNNNAVIQLQSSQY